MSHPDKQLISQSIKRGGRLLYPSLGPPLVGGGMALGEAKGRVQGGEQLWQITPSAEGWEAL